MEPRRILTFRGTRIDIGNPRREIGLSIAPILVYIFRKENIKVFLYLICGEGGRS